MDHNTKKKLISKYALHAKDTGSAQVQVAILTERINKLQEHLVSHPKDNHSRKGLLELVGKRRRHLNYLKLHTKNEYEGLIEKLKLKKVTDKIARKTVKKGPKKKEGKVEKKEIAKAPVKAKKVAKKEAKKATKKKK